MKVGRSVAQRDKIKNETEEYGYELDTTDDTDDTVSNVLDSMGT